MTVHIVYSEEMKSYDFGHGHPFRGDRYANFMQLFRDMVTHFQVIEPEYAPDEALLLVHDRAYIDFLDHPHSARWGSTYDYLTPDTPLTPGIARAARLLVGASLQAVEFAWQNKKHCIGTGGGLHHARQRYGAGFCIYNDVAVSVLHLLKNLGLERVMVLDTDAHAGDGTAEIFYRDPRVLFVDIHQDPYTLYPGTGFMHQVGEGEGQGYTVNIPVPPGTSDAAYEFIMEDIVEPLAQEFRPQLVIRNGGSDPHFADELTDLGLTFQGLAMIGSRTRKMADRVSDGRVVDLVGSGYNQQVLPGGWLSLVVDASSIARPGDLKEPFAFSMQRDSRLGDVKELAKELKKRLSHHWRCFR